MIYTESRRRFGMLKNFKKSTNKYNYIQIAAITSEDWKKAISRSSRIQDD